MEKKIKVLTLCIIHQHPRVLLGMKKRGFGAGRWNGFGGKVQEGEEIEDAALRELHEEVGIEPYDMERMGVLEFSFENDPVVLQVHIFKAIEFSGEPMESEEMKPEWFEIADIPFKNMWSDDVYWFPYFLKNKKFRGRFHFDKPSTAEYSAQVLEKEIQEVRELE